MRFWSLLIGLSLATAGCTDNEAITSASKWYKPWFANPSISLSDDAQQRPVDPNGELDNAETTTVQEPGSTVFVEQQAVVSVARLVTIKVKRGETLGLYSKWSAIPADELQALNQMGRRRGLKQGKSFQLMLGADKYHAFEKSREDHFTNQEKKFYTRYEVTELTPYVIKKGDRIWKILKKHKHVPVWLLQKFNAGLSFAHMKTGDELYLPTVIDIADAGDNAASRLWSKSTPKPTGAVKTVAATKVTKKNTEPPSGSGMTVKIAPKETLGHFSRWAGISIKRIIRANTQIQPNRLRIGQLVHVPVPDKRIAEFYLKRRKFHGVRSPAILGPSKAEISKRTVAKRSQKVAKADSKRKRAAAARLKRRDTLISRVHKVARGDTAWKLAVHRYKISLRSLQKANPGKNLNRLSEGDTLHIPKRPLRPGGPARRRAP